MAVKLITGRKIRIKHLIIINFRITQIKLYISHFNVYIANYLTNRFALSFTNFDLDNRLLEGLSAMNFSQPTPIQELAIPSILNSKDLIACAQTGTGKTAAYLLPILHKIAQSGSNHINTIILAPTRELALQIDQQLEGFAYFVPVSSVPVYGGGDGASWDQQKSALVNGADIVIATPGRLIAH